MKKRNEKKPEILLKKSPGMAGVMDFAPVLMLVMMGAYLLINCGFQIKYLDTINRLENLSQKYVLLMESTNGLTNADMARFYEELDQMGIDSSEVDFEGTTFWDSNVEYGDEIYLNLKAKVPYLSLNISENMSCSKNFMKKEVNIVKCALALA